MTFATKPKRPSGVTHQRRVGAHQKQTKHFMKTYWPYLPLFSLAGFLIIGVGLRALGPTGAVIGSASVVIGGAILLV